MYTDQNLDRWLREDLGESQSSLTLGSEEVARLHCNEGAYSLAYIHRMPIDVARRLLIFLQARHPLALREAVEWLSTVDGGFILPPEWSG